MARPLEQGIRYFSHDTNPDEKLEYLELIHPIFGYAIYFKLLEYGYSNNGYFIEWTEIHKKVFLAKKCHNSIEETQLDQIIQCCLEIGLFDRKTFKNNNVLTSRSMQKRFLEAARRRKGGPQITQYDLTQPISGNGEELMSDYVVNNPASDVNPAEDVPGKEIKGKEIKGKATTSYARAREEDEVEVVEEISLENFAEKIPTDPAVEQKLMLWRGEKFKITPEEIPKWVDAFELHLASEDKQHTRYAEYRKHWYNWVSKKLRSPIKNSRDGPRINQAPTGQLITEQQARDSHARIMARRSQKGRVSV